MDFKRGDIVKTNSDVLGKFYYGVILGVSVLRDEIIIAAGGSTHAIGKKHVEFVAPMDELGRELYLDSHTLELYEALYG